MKLRCLFLFVFLISTAIYAQKVRVVRWPEVQKVLQQQSDTTYIVNFWATWCKPCVVELPYFEKIQKEYKEKKVSVLLISMDFVPELTTRVVPFVKNRKLTSKIWLLNEPDANSWIDKVSKTWSGAIPATLIFNNFKKKRSFFEQQLGYNQLEQEVMRFL